MVALGWEWVDYFGAIMSLDGMDLPPVVDFRDQCILCDLRCCWKTQLGVVARAGRQVPGGPMIGKLQVVRKQTKF